MRSPLAWIVLFDSNVEAIPSEVASGRASIRSQDSIKRGKGQAILDRAVHHFAMRRLPNSERRGRPDIVHVSILSIADSPAYSDGLVNFVVHTVGDKVIVPTTAWRPPRNYRNFLGLMEDLLQFGRAPSTGRAVLRLENSTIKGAVDRTRADRVVLLSSHGNLSSLSEEVKGLRSHVVAYLVGGYAKGEPRQEVVQLADKIVSIHRSPLSSSTVISRLLYEIEKSIGQP